MMGDLCTLLMKAVSEQSSLLAGPPTQKVLLHNTLVMSEWYYRSMGEMIVQSITQGGPGPGYFSSVIDYVLSGIGKVKPSIADIRDYHVQEMTKKVGFASNLTNVINLWLFLSGNLVIQFLPLKFSSSTSPTLFLCICYALHNSPTFTSLGCVSLPGHGLHLRRRVSELGPSKFSPLLSCVLLGGGNQRPSTSLCVWASGTPLC